VPESKREDTAAGLSALFDFRYGHAPQAKDFLLLFARYFLLNPKEDKALLEGIRELSVNGINALIQSAANPDALLEVFLKDANPGRVFFRDEMGVQVLYYSALSKGESKGGKVLELAKPGSALARKCEKIRQYFSAAGSRLSPLASAMKEYITNMYDNEPYIKAPLVTQANFIEALDTLAAALYFHEKDGARCAETDSFLYKIARAIDGFTEENGTSLSKEAKRLFAEMTDYQYRGIFKRGEIEKKLHEAGYVKTLGVFENYIMSL
jgi:hypothetical protein